MLPPMYKFLPDHRGVAIHYRITGLSFPSNCIFPYPVVFLAGSLVLLWFLVVIYRVVPLSSHVATAAQFLNIS